MRVFLHLGPLGTCGNSAMKDWKVVSLLLAASSIIPATLVLETCSKMGAIHIKEVCSMDATTLQRCKEAVEHDVLVECQ